MNTRYKIEEIKEIVGNAKAFLFDFDGTLINLDKLNVDGFAYVLKDMFNLDFTRDDFMKYISGRAAQNGLVEYLDQHKIENYSTKEIVSEFYIHKNRLIEERIEEEIYLMPGVHKFLEYYSKSKRNIIITSSRTEYVKRMLSYYSVYSYFERVFDRYSTVRGKPGPEPFLNGLEYLKLDSSECIAFEDSFYGLQSAKGAGIFTVGIMNEGWNDDFVYQLGDYTIQDYRELI